ncbi:hypothetical protein RHM62_02945 [Actimicrobium sp. CCC2.4]|uniref:hypothetical protein n=1 Tax=Actimicrobium sp. CCC2.4 TaxID=3048606 RepID=UPI002AC8BDC2|nr:hypothetical protein [Actimicrobium sp. CCC2.4]WPX32826.1 hypothetical protein RHM62_02945 [Actimicrobium sp. CCC2.4]
MTKPGAARQPVTSFCFAKKKVTKKKATADRCPSGSRNQSAKSGKAANSLRSDSAAFLSTFGTLISAAVFYAEFNTKHSLGIWATVGLALRERNGWNTTVVWFWVLGFGFWVLGFGFWVLGFGFWVLGFEVDAP